MIGRARTSAGLGALALAVFATSVAAQEPTPQIPVQQTPLQPIVQPLAQPLVQQPPTQPEVQQPVDGRLLLPLLTNPLQPVVVPAGFEWDERGGGVRQVYRQNRGLFNGTAVGPELTGLSATFSGYAGHDDDVRAAQSGGTARFPVVDGAFTGGSATIDYSRFSERLLLSSRLVSDIRNYAPIDHVTGNYVGDLFMNAGLTRYTRLAVVQSLEYGSLFRFSTIPGVGLAPGSDTVGDYAASDRKRLSSATSITVRRTLNSRSSLFARGGYLVNTADANDFDREGYGAGGGYERQVGRGLALVLGYDHQESSFAGGATRRRTKLNNVNLGVNYVKPLSFSRRTTLSITTGLARVGRETSDTAGLDISRATGSAALTHLIGATWTLEGTYNRGLQFVELSPDPYFVNAVGARLTGMLSRRLEFRATGSHADGQLRLSTTGRSRMSYSGIARLGYALHPALELSADYAYYFYDFQDATDVPGNVPPTMHRRTVRVNLRYWLPLLMKTR